MRHHTQLFLKALLELELLAIIGAGNTGLLQKQSEFLTIQPSLQPLCFLDMFDDPINKIYHWLISKCFEIVLNFLLMFKFVLLLIDDYVSLVKTVPNKSTGKLG